MWLAAHFGKNLSCTTSACLCCINAAGADRRADERGNALLVARGKLHRGSCGGCGMGNAGHGLGQQDKNGCRKAGHAHHSVNRILAHVACQGSKQS